jgi:hypothetical protein
MIRVFKNIFFTVSSSVLLLIYIWLITWDMPLGYIGLVVLTIGIILWRFEKLKFLMFSWGTIFIVTTILFNNSLGIYNSKSSEYIVRIQEGKDLNFKEKTSIYGLNLFMCASAYFLYPEVAKESLFLISRAENDIRIFEDGFFMDSPKIKSGFNNNQTKVTWSGSEYELGNPESRFALALNPCYLKTEELDDHKIYSVQVKVAYPERSSAILLRYPVEIIVEEGLFNYLQKENWLHTYTAIWQTRIYN